MGAITEPNPVKLFVGMLAAKTEWFAAAEGMLVARYGAVDLASAEMPFNWTDYYRDEMGEGLRRKFVSFERLIAPDEIIDVKHATNAMEKGVRSLLPVGPEGCSAQKASDPFFPKRPVNLDPGYLSLSKVVLATTKDYSHRLYLGRGIYAEVTLHFHKGKYEPWEWTYRDYRTSEYGAFFLDMRRRLTSP
jgi:hypothetical protein